MVTLPLSALIVLAPEGAEECEVIIPGDVLTRGGIQVVYAGLEEKCPKTGLMKPVCEFVKTKFSKYKGNRKQD